MATLADSFLADFDDDADDDDVKKDVKRPDASSSSSSSSAAAGGAAAAAAGAKSEVKPEPSSDVKSGFRAAAAGGGDDDGGETKDLDAMKDDDEDDEDGDEDEDDADGADGATGAASAAAGGAPIVKIKREKKVKTESAASSSAATSKAVASLGNAQKSSAVRQIASLLTDPKLKTHLELLALLQSQSVGDGEGDAADEKAGATRSKGIERNDEYNIIVKSNELTVEIDNEIVIIHKFIRDIYSTRFHELEQLVPNPLEYARCVKIIGNETDIQMMSDLNSLLPPNVILLITVSLSSTVGKPISNDDLKRARDGCDAVIALDEAKKNIFSYIESRMGYIAPNLSAIVGSDIAARLVGTAGGLAALSKIPSCNLQVLGQTRKTIVGFSTANKDLHMGLLSATDLMQQVPQALKNKTLRLLAAKCTLASRIDSFQDDASGDKGHAMRDEIEKKIEKWQEPPAPKKQKALPAPNDTPRKKRGGKRYRKQKEKFQTTELTKARNRMVFGKEENTDEYTGMGYGMIGQSGSGLTLKSKNTQKLSKHLSKKTNERLKKEALKKAVSSGPGSVAGTASSITFTPVQGIELVNPDAAAAKVREANDKYFSTTGSFFKVGPNRRDGTASSLPPVPKFGATATAAAGTAKPPVPKFGAAPTAAAASSSSSSAAASAASHPSGAPPPTKRLKTDSGKPAAAASSTAYSEFRDAK